MKKLPLLCTLCFILCIGTAFGYSSEDISNANYLADQGIVTKQTVSSKYRLDDKILRQEVIAMALKIKGIAIPTNTSCKKYFADATKNDWVCRAVELAADNGIITRSNKYTNPGKYVTRAEAFAMIYNASGLERLPERGGGPVLFGDVTVGWQKDLFWNILLSGILYTQIPGTKYDSNSVDINIFYFYPNNFATRAEVFSFSTTTTTTDLPKLPEFESGNIVILPAKLSCVKTEIEVGLGDPLCESDYYRERTAAYTGFLKALKEKDSQKIVQYGNILGAYNYGFSEKKYRLFGDSFVGINFGPQSWGDVQFPIYTVKGNTIIRQLFSTDGADYQEWEKAIMTKFDVKDIYDAIGTLNESKRQEIFDFANQYWYDRFEKMEIQ